MQKSLILLPTLCRPGFAFSPRSLCHQCYAGISKANTGSNIPLPFNSHLLVISDTRLFVLLYNKLGFFLKYKFLYTLSFGGSLPGGVCLDIKSIIQQESNGNIHTYKQMTKLTTNKNAPQNILSIFEINFELNVKQPTYGNESSQLVLESLC